MNENLYLLIIIFATVMFKAVANALNYWYNKTDNKTLKSVYGALYHIFE